MMDKKQVAQGLGLLFLISLVWYFGSTTGAGNNCYEWVDGIKESFSCLK